MCFYDQTIFACGDYKWGDFKHPCPREYRSGETCGMKLVMNSYPDNTTKCKTCIRIDTILRKREKECASIRTLQKDEKAGKKGSASIEKAYNVIKEYDAELKKLYSKLTLERGMLMGGGSHDTGTSSGLVKELAQEHKYPCVFQWAGCEAVWKTKNEWKRHAMTQHLFLEGYHCKLCVEDGHLTNTDGKMKKGTVWANIGGVHGQVFNQKDLFNHHLKRMHQENALETFSKGASAAPDKTHVEEWIQRQHENAHFWTGRASPDESVCPQPECKARFSGPTGWDDRMEHIWSHFEMGDCEGTNMGDGGLRPWAIENGVVEKIKGHWRLSKAPVLGMFHHSQLSEHSRRPIASDGESEDEELNDTHTDDETLSENSLCASSNTSFLPSLNVPPTVAAVSKKAYGKREDSDSELEAEDWSEAPISPSIAESGSESEYPSSDSTDVPLEEDMICFLSKYKKKTLGSILFLVFLPRLGIIGNLLLLLVSSALLFLAISLERRVSGNKPRDSPNSDGILHSYEAAPNTDTWSAFKADITRLCGRVQRSLSTSSRRSSESSDPHDPEDPKKPFITPTPDGLSLWVTACLTTFAILAIIAVVFAAVGCTRLAMASETSPPALWDFDFFDLLYNCAVSWIGVFFCAAVTALHVRKNNDIGEWYGVCVLNFLCFLTSPSAICLYLSHKWVSKALSCAGGLLAAWVSFLTILKLEQIRAKQCYQRQNQEQVELQQELENTVRENQLLRQRLHDIGPDPGLGGPGLTRRRAEPAPQGYGRFIDVPLAGPSSSSTSTGYGRYHSGSETEEYWE